MADNVNDFDCTKLNDVHHTILYLTCCSHKQHKYCASYDICYVKTREEKKNMVYLYIWHAKRKWNNILIQKSQTEMK